MAPVVADVSSVEWLENQPEVVQRRVGEEVLQNLIESATQQRQLSDNACIKMCHFLNQCRRSGSHVLRDLAYSSKTGKYLFKFYVEWNEKNQHRSMRQVIELLSSLILGDPDLVRSVSLKQELLGRLVSIINHQAAQPLVKPAFRALECFLAKRCVTTDDILTAFEDCVGEEGTKVGGTVTLDSRRWHITIAAIFSWMAIPETSPAAGKLIVGVFQALKHSYGSSVDDTSRHIQTWQEWIRRGLQDHPESLDNIKNYLFPPLFKLDKVGSLQLLAELSQSQITGPDIRYFDAQACLVVSALEVGKKLGIVDEPDTIEITRMNNIKTRSFVPLPMQLVGELLTHPSGLIRSSTLSVLVCSISTTRPFPPMALQLVRGNLYHFHADADAKFRNELLSTTKHMVERLRGAVAFLNRGTDERRLNVPPENTSRTSDPALSTTTSITGQPEQTVLISSLGSLLDKHIVFLDWYICFLFAELVPSASYQRHITALGALSILLRSGFQKHLVRQNSRPRENTETRWIPFDIEIFTGGRISLLFDLVLDSYEDVRSQASYLIQFIPQVSLGTSKSGGLPPILLTSLVNADFIARETGRADYADGVARLHQIVCERIKNKDSKVDFIRQILSTLSAAIQVAEDDLAVAVSKHPLHGLFSSLRLVWESLLIQEINETAAHSNSVGDWMNVQALMLETCSRTWAVVQSTVCNDAPEGFLPADIDDISAKDVLSYCFRATHESSRLACTVIGMLESLHVDSSHFDLLKMAGDLSYLQLSMLRHRGAFSTISITFRTCCRFAARFEERGRQMIEKWLKDAFLCINGQSSTTRRSAGIPALVTGIALGLLEMKDYAAVTRIVKDLLFVSQKSATVLVVEETMIPQVHGMNCLKDIFRHPLLKSTANALIIDCLMVASNSIKSDVWAIQNCGLILFRSLVDGMFGTSDSKLNVDNGWDGRSTKLSWDQYLGLPSLILQMLNETSDSNLRAVFLAMEMLHRAGPPDVLHSEILIAVRRHLASKIWDVRDVAARVFANLLKEEEVLAESSSLLSTALDSSNQAHGALTTIGIILDRRFNRILERVNNKSSYNGCFGASDETTDTINSALVHLETKIKSDIRSPAFQDLAPFAKAAFWDTLSAIFTVIKKLKPRALYRVDFDTWNDMQTYPFKVESIITNLDAPLRQARARLLVILTSDVQESTDLGQTLIAATQDDLDTACTMINVVLDEMTSSEASLNSQAIDIFTIILFQALYNDSSTDLKASALRGLQHIFESSKRNGWPITTRLRHFTSSDLYMHDSLCQSPALRQASLSLQGAILIHQYEVLVEVHDPLNDENFVKNLKIWGQALQLGISPARELDDRLSVIRGLEIFLSKSAVKLTSKILVDGNIFETLLALHDCLLDDDEEIRDRAAAIVSEIIGTRLVSLAAKNSFISLLNKNFGNTKIFQQTLLNRVTASEYGFLAENKKSEDLRALAKADIHSKLSSALAIDSTLFAVEEQNLYLDATREAVSWATLVQNATSIGPKWRQTAQYLAYWVIGGSDACHEVFAQHNDKKEQKLNSKAFSIFTSLAFCHQVLIDRVSAGLNISGEDNINEEEDWSTLLGIKDITVFQSFGTDFNRGDPTTLHSKMLLATKEQLAHFAS